MQEPPETQKEAEEAEPPNSEQPKVEQREEEPNDEEFKDESKMESKEQYEAEAKKVPGIIYGGLFLSGSRQRSL